MRNLYLLVLGNGVSTLGSSVYLIVVVLLLKDMTDSGVLLGLYQFLALIPAALLLPVTGPLVDRFSRRRIIIGADLWRGALMLILGGVALSPIPLGPAFLLLVSFLVGLGNALFVPAAQALIPELVPPGKLEGANGLRATTNQLSNLAGNALGGFAYAVVAIPVVFLFNGFSFLLSALQELWIRVTPEEDASAQGREGRRPQAILESAREGFGALRASRQLRLLIGSQVGLFLVSPPVVLSLPFLVEDRLGAPDWLVGLLLSSMLAGAVFAFLYLSGRKGRRLPVIPTAYTLLAVTLLLVPLWTHLFTLFLAALGAGVAAGAVYIEVSTSLQRDYPRELQGRLFALVEAGNAILAPMAYLLSGPLIELFGKRVELTYLVAAVPALLWTALLWRAALGGGRRA